jgi:hypothetical protein
LRNALSFLVRLRKEFYSLCEALHKRKNWLFAGSDRGGRAAATLYSLIASAKRHALDPFIYLRDLFLRIPTHPNKQIHQLLPDTWKRDILPTLNPSPRTLPIATR